MKSYTFESQLLTDISNTIDEINTAGQTLFTQDKIIIHSTPAEKYKIICAEAGFIRTVSWLYIIYYDIPETKFNIKYLSKTITQIYLLDNTSAIKHIKIVQNLRTVMHHHTSQSSRSDFNKIKSCREWFNGRCENSNPCCEEEWIKCLDTILEDAKGLFSLLLDCIRHIEDDTESKSDIITEWEKSISDIHPKWEYDLIVESVFNDLGLKGIDPKRYCDYQYQYWKKELKEENISKNFEKKLRKIVTRDIKPYLKENHKLEGKTDQSSPILNQTVSDLSEEKAEERHGIDTSRLHPLQQDERGKYP